MIQQNKNNPIQFWCHPIFGGTGIQTLLEKYYTDTFLLYSDDIKIDTSIKNVITFFWETDAAINLELKTHKSEFIELMKDLNDLGFYFIADYSTESNNHVDNKRIEFLKNLIESGIDLNRFYLATNNSDVTQIQYGPHLINHLHFPHFLLSTPIEMNKYVGDLLKYDSIVPTKDFICLNRRMQEHKFKFVNRLSERKLLPNINFTWVCNKTNIELLKNSSIVSELNIDADSFNSIQLIDDVLYGTELDTADEYLYTINPKWYFDSKVNLVTETNCYDSPTHLTEKTFKPIFLEKPFVVYATKEHLTKLSEFGFDTFENLIGKYDCTNIDDVIDAGIRLAKIYDTVEVKNSCKYNRTILLNNSTHQNITNLYFLSKI